MVHHKQTKDQHDVEQRRIADARCSKCGSSRLYLQRWETSITSAGVKHSHNALCADCGYWCDGYEMRSWRPFIAPGESGSHDQPADVIEVR